MNLVLTKNTMSPVLKILELKLVIFSISTGLNMFGGLGMRIQSLRDGRKGSVTGTMGGIMLELEQRI